MSKRINPKQNLLLVILTNYAYKLSINYVAKIAHRKALAFYIII